jgi:3-phosphoglycerate kinase
MEKLSARDLEVKGRRVLVHVDFNVPTKNIQITDDTRILESLPTTKLLRARGAKVILLAHFGRPKGKPPADLFDIVWPFCVNMRTPVSINKRNSFLVI